MVILIGIYQVGKNLIKSHVVVWLLHQILGPMYGPQVHLIQQEHIVWVVVLIMAINQLVTEYSQLGRFNFYLNFNIN